MRVYYVVCVCVCVRLCMAPVWQIGNWFCPLPSTREQERVYGSGLVLAGQTNSVQAQVLVLTLAVNPVTVTIHMCVCV